MVQYFQTLMWSVLKFNVIIIFWLRFTLAKRRSILSFSETESTYAYKKLQHSMKNTVHMDVKIYSYVSATRNSTMININFNYNDKESKYIQQWMAETKTP